MQQRVARMSTPGLHPAGPLRHLRRQPPAASLRQQVDKVASMVDMGKATRLAVINRFFGTPSEQVMEEVLSDDFSLGADDHAHSFTKRDYIGHVAGRVLPAIPDFNWGHACNGIQDKDGFVIVTVMANGHHSGAPLLLDGLAPLPPSGKHFCLGEEVQKVKVVGKAITRIQVLAGKRAGAAALYAALGGTLPPPAATHPAGGVPPIP